MSVSVLCIFRLFCHIFIQLFFQRSARHRKFSHSAVVSRRLCRVKYFFGFVLCHCFALGHYGRSARHCRFAMRLRHWHHRILSKKVSAVPRDAQRHVLEQRKSPQHSLAVRLHLFAAVCHEFRHSAGARHRQQFRYRRHGCFCRCGKD